MLRLIEAMELVAGLGAAFALLGLHVEARRFRRRIRGTDGN